MNNPIYNPHRNPITDDERAAMQAKLRAPRGTLVTIQPDEYATCMLDGQRIPAGTQAWKQFTNHPGGPSSLGEARHGVAEANYECERHANARMNPPTIEQMAAANAAAQAARTRT